jgi:hypothetical protein
LARIKKKEHERLDDKSIGEVIEALEAEKPITKKEAYRRLNIAENSARLTKIIDDYKERKEREQRFRAANRGKPASSQEIQECIKGYLDGEALLTIADRLYRSSNFVKGIVDKVGVPQRGAGDYFSPDLLPEKCVADSFKPGQVVWSARYNQLGIVRKELPSTAHKVYQVYLVEPIEERTMFFGVSDYGGRYASQPVYELGSLEHLKEHGVDVYRGLRPFFPKWLAERQ